MKTAYKFFALACVLMMLLGLTWQMDASALSKDGLTRSLKAAVKLGILGADNNVMGICSGTVIAPTGMIVTNFHCVGQTDIYGPSEDGLEHGELYNPDGLLLVAISSDTRKPPTPTFVAKAITGNPDQDVAVLQIVGMIDTKKSLPSNLGLTPNSLVDSDTVEIGDEVSIIGYPGVGGATVTFTEGKISGFLEEDGDENIDWFKTDAQINGGNSGGSAVNENGEVVGIPSATLTQDADVIHFIKPINQAYPVIKRAIDLLSGKGEINPGKPTTPPEVPAGKNFGALRFGVDYTENDGLVGETDAFDTGATQIYAAIPYKNMRDGTSWGYSWLYEGQEAFGEDNLKWEYGKEGELLIWLTNEDGLPDGEYSLEVYMSNKLAITGEFVIGEANPIDQPTSPDAPTDEGVVVTGRILDASTKKPIKDAVIVFLKPGKTVKDFDNAKNVDDVIWSVGVADASGIYTIDVPLEYGKTYSVLVGHSLYVRIAADNAFAVTSDLPSLIELEDLLLNRR